jgi:hypothetical protein
VARDHRLAVIRGAAIGAAFFEDPVPPRAGGDLLVEPYLQALTTQPLHQPPHILRIRMGMADEHVAAGAVGAMAWTSSASVDTPE